MPMSERQLDFFSDNRVRVEQGPSSGASPALVLSEIDDEELIAAIPESSLADSCTLAAEAGQRRLTAAVPALAMLCHRFAGFGSRRPVAEQAAAIEALVMIGGREAAHAVSRRSSYQPGEYRRRPCRDYRRGNSAPALVSFNDL
jgi:hypothetical protein